MIDKKLLKHIDWFTILLVFALVGIGLISLASIMASPFDGEESSISDYMAKLNLQYVKKQIVNFLVGIAAFIIVIVFDYQLFKPIIKYLYAGNVAVLLVLFAVEKTRGIQGWLVFEQIDRAIQPGELCKICIIVALAKVVSEDMERNQGTVRSFTAVAKALAICAIPTVLVMLQPDFGTAFVYICIFVLMLFIARIPWGYVGAAVAAAAVALPLGYFYVISDSQRWRIKVFLNPELDTQNYGYNVKQSKIAIGSGQMFGKGYFSEGTLAQLRFVPERHTDFVFAGIVEGLGFVGGTLLIVLYFALIFRWLYVAIKSKDAFGTCLVVGVMGMLLAHVFENVGMTIGLMPVTGIPLPFVSYGGSNLLTNMIGVGIVENVWMRRLTKK